MKNIIVHCPTKELWKKVQKKMFDKSEWSSVSKEILDEWDEYEEESCISILKENGWKMRFGTRGCYQEHNPAISITPAEEYLIETKTLDDLQKGDVVIDKIGNKRKVLARLENVVFLSRNDNLDYAGSWHTISDIKEYGYTLPQDPEVEKAIKLLEERGVLREGKIIQ